MNSPMNREECLNYLRLLLTDTIKVRSINKESGVTDEMQEFLGVEPWLYGKNCIVEPLTKAVNRFEGNKAAPIMELRTSVMNFSYIASHSDQLGVKALISKRDDPTHDIIFGTGGE